MTQSIVPKKRWDVLRFHMCLVIGILLFNLFYSCNAANATVSFTPLEGFDLGSTAHGISADGNTVVGDAQLGNPIGNDAFRWTQNTGMVIIGDPSGGRGRATSADGSVVVGSKRGESGSFEAFRWTENDGIVGLGSLAGGSGDSWAQDTSADGSVVVGNDQNNEAFRWTQDRGMEGLGSLIGQPDSRSSAAATSADGNVVVGFASWYDGYYASIFEAFRWTEGGGMVGLGYLPHNPWLTASSRSNGISADGNVVVGRSTSSNDSGTGLEAFRWTQSDGMVGLGHLPGGMYSSEAHDTSADGSVVVGSASGEAGRGVAFVWDESNGMQSVLNLLENNGLDMTGWELEEATGISDDGSTLIGYGTNPDGRYQAWVADISAVPEPTSMFLLGSGLAGLVGLRRKK